MKSVELRGMSDEQLTLTLNDTEKHLFQLRFQSATDRLETPSEIRKAKTDIARIKTEQRARELKALAALPDDRLVAALTGTGGPPVVGRRKPRRMANRLARIQTERAAKKPTAPAGKGK
jgi:large subunit ribosomal protein L29